MIKANVNSTDSIPREADPVAPSVDPPMVRPQMSLSMMMLVVFFATVVIAIAFYSARVKEVQDELSMLFGIKMNRTASTGRFGHLVFLLFLYSSPLMVAGLLSTIYGLANRMRSSGR